MVIVVNKMYPIEEIMVRFVIIKIIETITNLFAVFAAIIDFEMFVIISKVRSRIIKSSNFVYHQMFDIELNLS
jgi:hypothetical protein